MSVLTKADLQTIRFALCCAISERDSYADAWSGVGPEADEAKSAAARFEKLHRKLFGEASAVQQERERLASTPMVCIFEMGRSKS